MISASGRAGFLVGALIVLGWIGYSSMSVVADGKQPQIVRSISAAFSADTDEKAALPPQWADNMVLQRDVAIPISGTAEAGKEVTVIFGEQVKETTADANGNWRATLDPMPPSAEPRDLRIIPGCIKCSKEIRNVLVGDVWLCGGSQTGSPRAENSRNSRDTPTIRIARIGDPEIEETWQECKGEAARKLAPRYRDFAEALQADLSVPIGLLDCSLASRPNEAGGEEALPPVTLPEVVPFPIQGVLWSIRPNASAAGIQKWRSRSGQPGVALLLVAEEGASAELSREISALPASGLVVVGKESVGEAGTQLATEAQRLGKGDSVVPR